MPSECLPAVAALSLPARLAIALHLFVGYCQRRGLDHPKVRSFAEYLWRFIGLRGGEGFVVWEADLPALVDAGLGWEYLPGFEAYPASRGVSEAEFRRVLCCTTGVLYWSMYAAADEASSRGFLGELAGVVAPLGVAWPDLAVFAGWRWADGQGWGQAPSPQQLLQWRAAGRGG